MGDVQTAATTGLSLVGMWVWEICSSCTPLHSSSPVPSLLFFSQYQMALWLTPGPSPCSQSSFFPNISHVLTTSRWFRGEDCGRAINLAPVPCQTKLPPLFLQQSPSNYGFYTCREQSRAIWCCFVTVTCHSAWKQEMQSSCQRLEETG